MERADVAGGRKAMPFATAGSRITTNLDAKPETLPGTDKPQ